jgi:Ca2+-binding EF-hand superfamily protein
MSKENNKVKTVSEKSQEEFEKIFHFFGMKTTKNLIKNLYKLRKEINSEKRYLDLVIKYLFKIYDKDDNGKIDPIEGKKLLSDLLSSINYLFEEFLEGLKSMDVFDSTELAKSLKDSLNSIKEESEEFDKDNEKDITLVEFKAIVHDLFHSVFHILNSYRTEIEKYLTENFFITILLYNEEYNKDMSKSGVFQEELEKNLLVSKKEEEIIKTEEKKVEEENVEEKKVEEKKVEEKKVEETKKTEETKEKEEEKKESKNTISNKIKEDFEGILRFFKIQTTENIFIDIFNLRKEINNEERFLDNILTYLFNIYDTDNNGSIDKNELGPLLKDVLETILPRISEIQKEITNNEVLKSLEPLLRLYYEENINDLIKSSKKDLINEINDVEKEFRLIDSNNDGKIDIVEFVSFFKNQFIGVSNALKELKFYITDFNVLNNIYFGFFFLFIKISC